MAAQRRIIEIPAENEEIRAAYEPQHAEPQHAIRKKIDWEAVAAVSLRVAPKAVWLGCLAHMLRRRQHNRRSKAGWTAFMITLPFIGCATYVASAMGLQPRTSAINQSVVSELVSVS